MPVPSRHTLLLRLLLPAALLMGPTAARAAEPTAAPPPPPPAVPVLHAFPFLAGLPDAVDATVVRIELQVRRRARVVRQQEARRLRRSRTPEAVVRRAWLLQVTDRRTYDAQRGILWRARRAAWRLPGLRGREQRAALGIVDRMAAAHVLTADRLRPALLTLDRNTGWWTRRGAPAYGRSIVRGRGPVTLRYIAGQGLVLHQLGSWSQVNWLAGACLRDRVHCPRRRLRSAVDAMMAMAVRRDGVVRAESYFRFGRATPPWISAMTQGTAIQALTRSSAVLRSAPDRRRAKAALGAFSRPAPEGVAVGAHGGAHYLMYSSDAGLRVLNGHLQALTGLRDLATIGGSRRAAGLFRRGERAARVELRRADTGAWSRYADGGPEATVPYHRLVTGFLRNLCTRNAGRRYCQASRRFRRYLGEPTRVSLGAPAAPRARQRTPLRVWISKSSLVRVTVRDPRGRTVLMRTVALPRGSHRIAWTAKGAGRYRVLATAAGRGGVPAGQAVAQLRVRRAAWFKRR